MPIFSKWVRTGARNGSHRVHDLLAERFPSLATDATRTRKIQRLIDSKADGLEQKVATKVFDDLEAALADPTSQAYKDLESAISSNMDMGEAVDKLFAKVSEPAAGALAETTKRSWMARNPGWAALAGLGTFGVGATAVARNSGGLPASNVFSAEEAGVQAGVMQFAGEAGPMPYGYGTPPAAHSMPQDTSTYGLGGGPSTQISSINYDGPAFEQQLARG